MRTRKRETGRERDGGEREKGRERERKRNRERERERERESAVRTYAPSCYFNISLCHSVIRTYNIFRS